MPEKINSRKLFFKIKQAYIARDYASVIAQTEEYLRFSDIYIPITLFYYYGSAWQEMGNIDKAHELYEEVLKRGADSSMKLSIARRLNATKYALESYNLLKEVVQEPKLNSDLAYYLLGKKEMYLGNNEEALACFYKALEYAKDDTAKFKTVSLIKTVREMCAYKMITIDYNLYRLKGESLQNGHIVYLKRECNVKTTEELDAKKDKRPYLVIGQNDNGVVALPLTLLKITNYYYNLVPGKETGAKNDRYIMPELSFFSHDDISFIIGYTKLDLYYPLIKHLYSQFYHRNPQNLEEYQAHFLQDFNSKQKVNIYDIITLYNHSLNKYEVYFVTDEDEEFYYAYPISISLESSVYKIEGDRRAISKDTLLLYINFIGEDLRNNLLSQIDSTRK